MDNLIEAVRQLLGVRALIQWGGLVGITSIVFVETGLFFGFFLPGDSLLVTAGILAAAGSLDLKLLLIFPSLAAVIGDQTGFVIGRRAGQEFACILRERRKGRRAGQKRRQRQCAAPCEFRKGGVLAWHGVRCHGFAVIVGDGTRQCPLATSIN